jgi:hypothetical protein
MKDNQLKALLKKTAAKAAQQKKPARASFDPTLDATRGGKEPVQARKPRKFSRK